MTHRLPPDILSSPEEIYAIAQNAPGPGGFIPFSEEQLRTAASGHLFGLIQNVGMGWPADHLDAREFLILSTQGGWADAAGKPIALGLHSGHFELHRLVAEAAQEFRRLSCVPFAAFCTDPCDGRTQGTPGMMDSLAYRNDSATLLRRLVRSLPTRSGVLGIATCDKGLPAMMMTLAAQAELACILVPGGVTLPPQQGEDLGKIQSIGARFSQGEVTLAYAQQQACRACASPGGGCQFLGTAATSQVVGEALGLSLPHSALAPSGQPVWLDMARRSSRALLALHQNGLTINKILTQASVHNAMTVMAAFGGSTNLLLHVPAIAHAAGLKQPTIADWIAVNRNTPRLVDVMPNGPVGHPTIRAFLAGGVPEVMLHLRRLQLLDESVLTVSGMTLRHVLDWWAASERRQRFRAALRQQQIDPDDVIMDPDQARSQGITGTTTFPSGNLAPEGSVIKSTAIASSLLVQGVFDKIGPARVFTTESAAILAIKQGQIRPGDVMVLICVGPLGSGMEEIFQITSALRYLKWGKEVAVLTDGRFSGVSTGACIGHIGPEALAGGAIGKILDGDMIHIHIDCRQLRGSIDLVGEAHCAAECYSDERGSRLLAERPLRADLRPRSDLPADTRLWAALQQKGGGTWGGCVYDADAIIAGLTAKRT